MQPRSHTCALVLICLICLAGLATTSAQACKNKFANFTTCAMLNGVRADGDAERVKYTNIIDSLVREKYESDTRIRKTNECWQEYVGFHCVALPSMNDDKTIDKYSAPCASDGTRLRPCNSICVNFYQKCYKLTAWQVFSACEVLSDIPEVTKCYGTDGVLGMTSSASLKATSWAVALLALAVARLGMSSSS